MSILPPNADILPPSDDRIFKLLLTHPDAKPALMDLISALIGRKVVDVQIHNNELPAADTDEKAERLDVNTVIDTGEQINIEMAASRIEESGAEGHSNLLNKGLYYLTDLFSSQKSKGMKYEELVRTYQVTFCKYTVFPDWDHFLSSASMRRSNGEMLIDKIVMIMVELSKLKKIVEKPVEEMTPLEAWSVFFQYAPDPDRREVVNRIIAAREELDMAGTLLTSISKDEHERAKFMSRHKAEMDRVSNLRTVEERGEASGKAIGKKEATLKIAKNMKTTGMAVNYIIQITGLTDAEIEDI
jgi:predicted transposase/invertase (TIGR01784 family)